MISTCYILDRSFGDYHIALLASIWNISLERDIGISASIFTILSRIYRAIYLSFR